MNTLICENCKGEMQAESMHKVCSECGYVMHIGKHKPARARIVIGRVDNRVKDTLAIEGEE